MQATRSRPPRHAFPQGASRERERQMSCPPQRDMVEYHVSPERLTEEHTPPDWPSENATAFVVVCGGGRFRQDGRRGETFLGPRRRIVLLILGRGAMEVHRPARSQRQN